MQIKDIYNQFTVNEHGIIEDCGMFEGCKYFIPYYWNSFLNGIYDSLEGEYVIFDLFNDDKVMFPELIEYQQIRLYENKHGFIYGELL